MPKLVFTDSGNEMLMKLAERNIGAVAALTKTASAIAPYAGGEFEFIGMMLELDRLGIYGSRIHILFKDVCKGRPDNLQRLLQAVRMHWIQDAQLLDVIDACERGRANLSEGVNMILERAGVLPPPPIELPGPETKQ